VSRYDYIYIDIDLFALVDGMDAEHMEDIKGLEFQTKDLEREFLEYFVGEDKQLYYEDFHYELVDSNNDGLFGNSGEAMEVAERLWAKTCQKEAAKMLEGFTQIGIPITKPVTETTPTDGSTSNPDNNAA